MVRCARLRPALGAIAVMLAGGVLATVPAVAAGAAPVPNPSRPAAAQGHAPARPDASGVSGGSASDGTRTLRVNRATGLNPAGSVVTVTGSGYDLAKGIYVAVCVDNGPGAVPSPCIGGVDLSGGSGGSVWISSNPPPYGEGLAEPYGKGGTFSVSLAVVAHDAITRTDCRDTPCAVITRNDHTRPQDRSQDLRIPITFAAPAPSTSTTPPAPRSSRPAVTTAAPTGTAGPATDAAAATAVTSHRPQTSTAASRDSSPGSSSPPTSAEQPVSALARSDAVKPAANTTGESGFPVLLVVLVVIVAAIAVGGLLFHRRRRR